jgi:hypothetical protein
MHDLIQQFHKYINGKCSPEEVAMLFEQLDREENKQLKDELIREQLAKDPGSHSANPYIKERLDELLQKILAKIDRPDENKGKIRYMRWWLAAAAVFLLVASITYLEINRKPQPVPVPLVHKATHSDIPAPAMARAILKLDDGKVLDLDSAGNGLLAAQGDVRIMKTAEGQITYKGKESSTIQYNTLTNPRGSKVVSLTLADGTKVWLNAETSLRYPTAFTGKERKVELTGEAYFEVAHNARMPFKVSKAGMTIQVLGTHFNVNAYDNEAVSRITLLEGSVRVSSESKQSMLAPGQQARLQGASIQVINDVNTEEAIAWKNGKFQFSEKTDIGTIMRQLARWYNVDITYQGNVSQHFWGSIPRDITISQVLQKIESTGGVRFRIEGNNIIVMP